MFGGAIKPSSKTLPIPRKLEALVKKNMSQPDRNASRTRRGEARDRNLFQTVALSEVPEGGMTRHDLAARAIAQAGPILAVELPELGRERAGRAVEGGPDPPHDPLEEDRIKPDVRVGGKPFLVALVERQAGQDVDPLALCLRDRLADGGLEPVTEI